MRIALVLTVVLAITLSGCSGDEPSVLPQPVPSSTPIFASDEEALAAAEEAYGAYQAAEDAVLNGGGVRPELLEGLAVGEALEGALTGFSNFEDASYHSVGDSTFEMVALQQYSPFSEGGHAIVSAYVCLDVSGVDVLDSTGQSVIAPDRPALQAFEVAFDLLEQSRIVVASREPWSGAGVCAT